MAFPTEDYSKLLGTLTDKCRNPIKPDDRAEKRGRLGLAGKVSPTVFCVNERALFPLFLVQLEIADAMELNQATKLRPTSTGFIILGVTDWHANSGHVFNLFTQCKLSISDNNTELTVYYSSPTSVRRR